MTIAEKKVFAPGVYDITAEEYHASAGISRSGIVEFKKSPHHYWYKYINPAYVKKSQSAAHAFGSAFHALVIEPETFNERYFVPEKNPYHPNSTAGKEFKAEMLKRAEGKILLDPEDLEELQLMSVSIMKNYQAMNLIKDAQYEKSIFWIDKETGLLCKCRPDIWHESFIVDLKTTANASFRSFKNDFYAYSYPLQLAMMNEGIKHATGKIVDHFIDLAVEKTPPYAHAIYPIDDSALQHGLDEFRFYINKIKECIDTDTWDGYPSQILTLPNYATIGE